MNHKETTKNNLQAVIHVQVRLVAAVGVRVVGVDSVGGDSGVAAVARDRLVGIVSGIVVVGLVGDLGRKEGRLSQGSSHYIW